MKGRTEYTINLNTTSKVKKKIKVDIKILIKDQIKVTPDSYFNTLKTTKCNHFHTKYHVLHRIETLTRYTRTLLTHKTT